MWWKDRIIWEKYVQIAGKKTRYARMGDLFLDMKSLVPQVYSQVYLHLVFAVKFRKAMIGKQWKIELYKYMNGIIQRNGHKVLAINGMDDHIHIFIGFIPRDSISSLVKLLKVESSNWINQNGLTEERFYWQNGYGVFSYAYRDIDKIIKYIANQEAHHAKVDFRREYISILKVRQIPFEENRLFHPLSGD